MVLKLSYGWAIAYQCTEVAKGRVTWRILHSRYYRLVKDIRSEYIKTIVSLGITHLVFDENEELDYDYHLNLKTKYSAGDLIIRFNNRCVALYKCKKVVKEKVIWKEMERKESKFGSHIDFEHIKKMLHLKVNDVHIVCSNSQEMVDLLSNSEVQKYNFKSTNFIDEKVRRPISSTLIFARHLSEEPEISVLVKIKCSN